MAVERTSVDGYGPGKPPAPNPALAPYPRDRQTSDGIHHEQHHNAGHAHGHHRPMPEVDREAFSILREQVSYNYQCIQQDRDAIARFDAHLGQFQATVMRMFDDFRHEAAARAVSGPSPATGQPPGRADHGDIEVLANQIVAVTTKANEIDNLKIQLELMKTRVRRLEDENASLRIPRPGSAASHRDGPEPQPQPQYHGGHSHQHLPPIQTGASTSPTRGHSYPSEPTYPHREQRNQSGDAHPVYRADAPGPPHGWRPAVGVAALTPHPSNSSIRSTPHDGDSQSWAPVNAGQAKRPYEDGPPRDHSAPTSPKRPKLAPLAPLKPRNSVGEEPPTSYPQQGPPEQHPLNTRLPLHDRQPAPPQLLTTPASATGPAPPNAYKFIATTPLDASEHWRELDERGLTPTSARGRGRGRGRGMRSRGGRDSNGHENGQEHGTPEWEQKTIADWHAPGQQPQHQLSPNGYYAGGYRPIPPRTGEAAQHEYPLTPIASAVSPSDHSLMVVDGPNKKTRTKPIRNADGVLIRKDGRPDMRSVSSANNLRKVHAKKEAERAETDGRTPISARELAPAGQSFTNSDEDGDEEHSVPVDEVSRSASPRTQGEAEREDVEKTREESASGGEDRKPYVQHKWISSKYERGDEVQEKRRSKEGVDEKAASPEQFSKAQDIEETNGTAEVKAV